MKNFPQIAFGCLRLALALIACPSSAIAQIQVTSAAPNNATQGTVDLNVVVTGSGFKKGAKAQWFLTGTTNPGCVTANSTAVSSFGYLAATQRCRYWFTHLKAPCAFPYFDGRTTFDDVPQLYIDPVECIDCGACVPVCAVSAIFALDDLPEKWKEYTELNESYVNGGKFTPEEYAKHQVK